MLFLGRILILDKLTLWPHDVLHTIWNPSSYIMCALVAKKKWKKLGGRYSLIYSSLTLRIKDSNQKEKLVWLLLIGPEIISL